MDNLFQQIGDFFAICIFIVSTTFVIINLKRRVWFDTIVGRTLMMTLFMFASVFGLATATILFGTGYPARPVIRMIIFAYALFLSARWLILLVNPPKIKVIRDPENESLR